MKLAEKFQKFFFLSKEYFVLWLLIAIGFCWRVFVWSQQPGPYLDDEVGHYLLARDAWRYPELIFSFWGRTVCTLFYMPGALFGWKAARLLSFLATTLTVFITLNIALELKTKKLSLVVILLELQPWFFNNTHEVLTEVPAMLCLSLAIYLWLINQTKWVSFLVGLLPLIRHELVVLVVFWGIILLWGKNWKAIIICALPLVITNVLSFIFYGVLPLTSFLVSKGTDLYGKGSWFHYLNELASYKHLGLSILVLSLLGLGEALAQPKKLVVILSFPILFLLNTVIYHYGLFSSGGFGIFLLPCAPLVALLASWGAEFLIKNKEEVRKTTTIVDYLRDNFVFLIFLFWAFYGLTLAYQPRGFHGEARAIKEITDYLKEKNFNRSQIAAMNVWFYLLMPQNVPVENEAWHKTLWTKNYLASLKKNDLLVWDVHYSNRWGHDYKLLTGDPSKWEQLKEVNLGNKVVAALFLRK